MRDLEPILHTVQRNCDISDARFAGQQTLCIYLLQMREHYRWEKGLPLGVSLPKAEVGAWLSAREQLWERIEEHPYAALPLDASGTDPFEYAAVNQALVPRGYVYSAGIGRFGKPHFFLAQLARREEREGFTIYRTGREHARDLNGPPAMLHGHTIFIREDLVQRWLWEKIEEHRWHKTNSAMERALRAYGHERAPEAALADMAARESESMLLHELGEGLAGKRLGPAWEEMLAALPRSRAEIIVRALRDNLADCLVTLPSLLADRHEGPLHFYFAQLQGMRRHLFPEAIERYRQLAETGERAALAAVVRHSADRFETQAHEMLALFHARGASAAALEIEARLAPACAVDQRPRAVGVQ